MRLIDTNTTPRPDVLEDFPYDYSDTAIADATAALRSIGFIGADTFARKYDCADIVAEIATLAVAKQTPGYTQIRNVAAVVRVAVIAAHHARLQRWQQNH